MQTHVLGWPVTNNNSNNTRAQAYGDVKPICSDRAPDSFRHVGRRILLQETCFYTIILRVLQLHARLFQLITVSTDLHAIEVYICEI